MAPVGLSRYLVEQDFWFGVHQVATPALDQLLQAHTLGGIRRPALAYNRLNGMLKGFIDLTVEHEGRYYVLDWKSNWLGPDAGHYHPAAMRQSMAEKRHDVQLALYLLALHRHLRQRLPDYDYDTHVGGALYVYLRGTGEPGRGVYHEKPSRELIEALDALFADATATAEEIA
jgi:exodeoxyribonuclease V beta subunit